MKNTTKHIIFDCYGTLINTGNGSIKAVEQILKNVGANIDATLFYAHWKKNKRNMMNTSEFLNEKRLFELSLAETFSHYKIKADPAKEVEPMIQSLVHRLRNNWTELLVYFPDCTYQKSSAMPASPTFFDMHTQKNILRNSSSYLRTDILVSERKAFPDVKETLYQLAEQGIDMAIGSTTDTDPLMYSLNINHLTFKHIYTSEDIKAYKPNPVFYKTILERTGWLVEECLFVGDNYIDDVCGPKSLGMKAMLIDRKEIYKGKNFNSAPDYIINSLEQLIEIL